MCVHVTRPLSDDCDDLGPVSAVRDGPHRKLVSGGCHLPALMLELELELLSRDPFPVDRHDNSPLTQTEDVERTATLSSRKYITSFRSMTCREYFYTRIAYVTKIFVEDADFYILYCFFFFCKKSYSCIKTYPHRDFIRSHQTYINFELHKSVGEKRAQVTLIRSGKFRSYSRRPKV